MAEIVTIPLWDPVFMGNPFYIWLILIMGAAIALGIALFKLEVYDRLEPVWGYRDASMGNIPQAIVRGMSGKIKLLPVTEVAGIFSAMGIPLKWIQTVPSQGQLGKVNTIEVSDDWNIVHNVEIDYAIVEAVHKWNEVHPETTKGHIYDSESFDEHLMNGDLDAMFPKGIRLPPFRNVDLHEIRRYLPKWTASHHSGYITAELDKRKKEDDGKGSDMFKWALLGGAVILGAAVLGYIILSLPKG
jgi:hypothetical protein